MGFTSMDDLVNKVTNTGNFWRQDWDKQILNILQTGGEWYSFFVGTGNPPAGATTAGTSLSLQSMCNQTVGAIQSGAAVSPSTKHVLSASAAAAVPAYFMLVDLLGYYPMSTVSAGAQNAINSVTFTCTSAAPGVLTTTGYDFASFTRVQLSNSGGALPTGFSALTDYWTIRQSATTSTLASSMANAIAGTGITTSSTGSGTNTITALLHRYTDGKGVQCFVAATGTMGAGQPTLQLTYTNPASASGHVTPAPLPLAKASTVSSHLVHTGTGPQKPGPFIPLAAGDNGILQVQSMTLGAYYVSGALAWVLCKPLFVLPAIGPTAMAECDFLNRLPSLPQIQDYACLAWLMCPGTVPIGFSQSFGHLDFGWG